MSDEKYKIFETPDPYLTAAIVVFLKIEPEYIVYKKKTFARFQATDNLYQAMGAYNAGAQVSAIDYADAIKVIRAEFIRRRNNDIEGAHT